MFYIAALDYDHMDNGVFLTTLARSLAEQQDVRSIVIHGDSEYTERIIQSGIMRDQAQIRCIKDLNNRLVALFADQGVSTIGLNGYQRNIIEKKNGSLEIDADYLNSLPSEPVLLLSNIISNKDTGSLEVVPLNKFFTFLNDRLKPDESFVFSKEEAEADGSREGLPPDPENDENIRTLIPEEFRGLDLSFRLTTANLFDQLPLLDGTHLIGENR